MKKYMYILVFLCLITILILEGYGNGLNSSGVLKEPVQNKSNGYICMSYFGSEGCHNCEDVANVIATDLFDKHPNLVVIIFELEEHPDNAGVIGDFNAKYRTGFMVPIVIFDKEVKGAGGKTLHNKVKDMIAGFETNKCPLVDDEIAFEELEISSIPGDPQIWLKDRILVRIEEVDVADSILQSLLLAEDVEAAVSKIKCEEVHPEHHEIVENLCYRKAVKIGGWLFQWEPYFEE